MDLPHTPSRSRSRGAVTSDLEDERLVMALEASGMGMWEWNVVTDELVWSDRLKALFGLSPEEPISYEKYLTLLHPQDRAKMQGTIKRSMKSGGEYKVEHRIIWPDGSVHWLLGQGRAFLQDGHVVRMIGTSMNIDERKATESRLQESEARFRSMADTAPVMIWVVEADGRCTYVNKQWLNFTGLESQDDMSELWQGHMHPEDRPHCLEQYAAAFNKQVAFSMEYRLRRHDGNYRWIFNEGVPRFNQDGVFEGFVGTCIDIDDIKRTIKRKHELEEITESLTKQRAQLVALNNAKDEFISIASHQLRTPATVVKQYVGMMVQGYVGELNDVQLKMLQAAYDSNERQLGIVEDLLRVAHVDAGRVRLEAAEFDLHGLLAEIAGEQRPKFKDRGQAFLCEISDEPLIIKADIKMLRMVFENIIDNASKYTPTGKRVRVFTVMSNGEVAVHIKDRGVGIASEDLPKLFRKFSRIDNKLTSTVGGSGLGLYWAKHIVDLHGGSIDVKSRVGHGTEFIIKLPTVS